MKKFLLFFCAVMLIFGMAGTASAIPYTDTYDVGNPSMRSHLLSPDDSVSWTFDITNDGFNPLTQDVTSASISLNFRDDSGSWWDGGEIADLDVGDNYFYWGVDTGDISFAITSLMTLSSSGTIDCTLTAEIGDFYFNNATLSAEGTEPVPAPVPEPSTILLMGAGLLGLAGYNRKRLIKKS